MSSVHVLLHKILTANDVGATGSHQAGIVVPKSITGYFPALDESLMNPDAWIDVVTELGDERWRYIHYNNRVVGSGTRDEYRLTHVTGFLRTAAARVGDALELERVDDYRYACDVRAAELGADTLTLTTSGPWRVVQLKRR
jgi:hypothetical protein